MLKISFVIPMYNVEKYISECLDSIINQSYENYEVILVDDGSSDDTVKIASDYVEKNQKIHLYKQANGGASKARNNGIRHASGDYIFFLDSDDFLYKDALSRLMNQIGEVPYDVLKFSAYTFIDGNDDLKWDTDGYKLKGEYKGDFSGKDFLKKSIEYEDAYLVNCGHVLVNRKYIIDNNLFFYEGIIHEDVLYHWELMIKAKYVGVFNEPISCRRYRKGSVMERGNWKKRIFAMSAIINETYSFIENNDDVYEEDALWFLRLYAIKILQFYLEMSKEERKHEEVLKLLEVVKNQMKKYNYWGKFNIRLFAINPFLYECYHKLNRVIR